MSDSLGLVTSVIADAWITAGGKPEPLTYTVEVQGPDWTLTVTNYPEAPQVGKTVMMVATPGGLQLLPWTPEPEPKA